MSRTIAILWTILTMVLMPVFAYASGPQDYEGNGQSSPQGGLIANLLQESGTAFGYFYEDNYFLFTATNDLNREALADDPWATGARDMEIKYQISLALPISRGLAGDNSVLGVSYTQCSWWQALNPEISSPFRETNYEPQLFLGWATDYSIAGWSLQEVEVGLNHQSNGRSGSASRGWNRGYLRLMAQKDNWQIDLKPWFLIGEPDPVTNPNITKYLGYYRLKISHSIGKSLICLKGRYNWNTGYGGAELNWSYPISPNTQFYAQLFSGYSESLIDYNYNQTRFGIGLTVNKDWRKPMEEILASGVSLYRIHIVERL